MNVYVNKLEDPIFQDPVCRPHACIRLALERIFKNHHCIFTFISLEKDVALHFNKLEECFLPSLLERTQWFWRKRDFKSRHCTFTTGISCLFPLEIRGSPSFNPFTKNALCQVWLKFPLVVLEETFFYYFAIVSPWKSSIPQGINLKFLFQKMLCANCDQNSPIGTREDEQFITTPFGGMYNRHL